MVWRKMWAHQLTTVFIKMYLLKSYATQNEFHLLKKILTILKLKKKKKNQDNSNKKKFLEFGEKFLKKKCVIDYNIY